MRALAGRWGVRPWSLNVISLCLESAEARLMNAVMSCETAQTTFDRISHHLILQVMTHNLKQNEAVRSQLEV